jgi:HEAT repeats
MSKKNTPEKTLQRTLVFVALFIEFLGISIFAGINVFAAHQKNQDFSQLDAEEKFSRLPEYLLKDLSLLKDKNWRVRVSAAKALGDLGSREAISELTKSLNDSHDDYMKVIVREALDKLHSRNIDDRIIDPIQYLNYGSYSNAKTIIISPVLSSRIILKPKKSFLSEIKMVYIDSSVFVSLSNLLKQIAVPIEKDVNLTLDSLSYDFIYPFTPVGYELSNSQLKKVISQLIIKLDASEGFEQYQILEALIVLEGLNESQIREGMLKVIRELEMLDVLSDSEKKHLAIDVSVKIYLKFNQKLKKATIKSTSIYQSREIRDQQWTLTGYASVTSLFLLLLTLLCLKEMQRIAWKDHLTCYFPEETVGELIALRHELTQAKKPTVLVEAKLLYVIFTLIWAFYIQINIDNLWLPSKDQRRR